MSLNPCAQVLGDKNRGETSDVEKFTYCYKRCNYSNEWQDLNVMQCYEMLMRCSALRSAGDLDLLQCINFNCTKLQCITGGPVQPVQWLLTCTKSGRRWTDSLGFCRYIVNNSPSNNVMVGI